MPDSNNIEMNSTPHEIDDMINISPGWLLRSGISILAIVVVVIISFSTLIKYPDKISSKGIMTSDSPPIEHKSVSGGIAELIYVHQNDTLLKGDPILLVQSSCNFPDVKTLQQFLSKFESINNYTDYLNLEFPVNLQLGELQSEYAKLEFYFAEFKIKLSESGDWNRIKILENNLFNVNELSKVLINQKTFEGQELALIKKDYIRNYSLYQNGVISETDLEKSQIELLRSRKKYNDIESRIVENELKTGQIRLEINQLTENRLSLENEYFLKIKEIISRLKQGITIWENKYLLRSEIPGIISFKSNVTHNVRLEPNQVVATILPIKPNSAKLVRAFTSGKGIGKIEKGNRVILKIDGYPYKEYGTVTSQVSSISIIPNEDNQGNSTYEVNIPLPQIISTSYHKIIPFKVSNGVVVDIITEDKSLFERVFDKFLNLIKNI